MSNPNYACPIESITGYLYWFSRTYHWLQFLKINTDFKENKLYINSKTLRDIGLIRSSLLIISFGIEFLKIFTDHRLTSLVVVTNNHLRAFYRGYSNQTRL